MCLYNCYVIGGKHSPPTHRSVNLNASLEKIRNCYHRCADKFCTRKNAVDCDTMDTIDFDDFTRILL